MSTFASNFDCFLIFARFLTKEGSHDCTSVSHTCDCLRRRNRTSLTAMHDTELQNEEAFVFVVVVVIPETCCSSFLFHGACSFLRFYYLCLRSTKCEFSHPKRPLFEQRSSIRSPATRRFGLSTYCIPGLSSGAASTSLD